MLTIIAVIAPLAVLLLVLSAFGYSWSKDPEIRALAERPGWRLARPAEEIQRERDQGTFNPSRLRVEMEGVALVKLRRATLAAGSVAVLIAAVALAISAISRHARSAGACGVHRRRDPLHLPPGPLLRPGNGAVPLA